MERDLSDYNVMLSVPARCNDILPLDRHWNAIAAIATLQWDFEIYDIYKGCGFVADGPPTWESWADQMYK